MSGAVSVCPRQFILSPRWPERDARPELSVQVIKELLTCRFVDERRNLILVGRASTGKTTVACAIGHAACRRGLAVYYSPLSDLLAMLHAAQADGTYRRAFRQH